MTNDFEIQPEGSIALFRPLTDEARAWLGEHCPHDGEHQYFGGALVVEHRYVESTIEHIREEGLAIGLS